MPSAWPRWLLGRMVAPRIRDLPVTREHAWRRQRGEARFNLRAETVEYQLLGSDGSVFALMS